MSTSQPALTQSSPSRMPPPPVPPAPSDHSDPSGPATIHGAWNATRSRPLLAMAVGAIGVVFGDIGTSPLYTLQVAGESHPGGALVRQDVFGIVSLIVWALVLAISIKYVTFVMRADNAGEGGILALLALLPRRSRGAGLGFMAVLVIAGAALLFGDGMITPAISVLSALEGLKPTVPGFAPYVVPLTCVVLLGLFVFQRHGTGRVGSFFGPIMIVWFLTIGALGVKEMLAYPAILGALSPTWIVRYFARHGFAGLRIFGVVVLAITGGEALYADIGHFGVRPIRVSWFALVFPALALSYLGQGARVARDPSAIDHPLFAAVPAGVATYAFVALATVATVIASQALISGLFSLTHQAVQLGYFPRLTIHHTSSETEGQIYVPLVNWGLAAACIALVLGFRASSRLASAYGIAVSGTMAITSLAFFDVMRTSWKWSLARSLPLLVLFLSFDLPIVGANLLKFVDGGYVPIVAGAIFFVVMLVWKRGRNLVRDRVEAQSPPFHDFLGAVGAPGVTRVPGVAVYVTAAAVVPHMIAVQVERVKSLMEHVVLLTVVVEHEPVAARSARYEVEQLASGFVRVVLRFGYMERPVVPSALKRALREAGIDLDLSDATYFVDHETCTSKPGGPMWRITGGIFAYLARNAKSAVDHFGLPPDKVIELGTRVDV